MKRGIFSFTAGWLLWAWMAVSCTFDASGLPGANPKLCGNGQLDPGEPCDGELFSTTCRREGYIGGFLLCRPDCSMDMSRCVSGCGECVPDTRRCLDNKIFLCVEYGEGCGIWQLEQDCGASQQWCRADGGDVSCRDACVDQCEEGERACSAAGGVLEGCREVMATPIQVCRIWQTLADCTQSCEELPEPHCTDSCVDVCEEGKERCSVDRLRRQRCMPGYAGCLEWMDLFPYCVSGREICELYENDVTLCSCNLCEPGTRRCSADGTKVLECSTEGNCSTWNTFMNCDMLGMFARCSDAENYSCIPLGDSCSAVLPINPSPRFEASTDRFNSFFTNKANFSDPSCGEPLANAPEAFAGMQVGPTETILARQTSDTGPNVRFRIQENALCGDENPCIAHGDRTLVYTSFVARDIVIAAEVDWTSAHTSDDVHLVIERASNGCTDAETEPNEGFATANSLSFQASETWGFCTQLIPPNPGNTDNDCMAFSVPTPGRRIELRAMALDLADTCIPDLLVRLFRPDGTLIATSARPAQSPDCARIAPDEAAMASLVSLSPGTYKACISRDIGQPAVDVIARLNLFPPPATPLAANFFNCLPAGWEMDPAGSWQCNNSGKFMQISISGDQTGSFSLKTASVGLSGYNHAVLQFGYSFTTNNVDSRFRVGYTVSNGSVNLLADYPVNTSGRQVMYVPADPLLAGNDVRVVFWVEIGSAGSTSSTQAELDDVTLHVW